MVLPQDTFYLIAGPCVIEDMDILKEIADELVQIKASLGIEVFFKSSFDKANRTSISSFRGPGLEKGLDMLSTIKKEYGLKILTDVHTPDQIKVCSEVIDLIQIPAFLARQTDFYIEAGKYKVALNVKKGQFMSPQDMERAITKFKDSGGVEITITERGTFFGYGNLVVDFRSLDIIKAMGVKYIFDATHSVLLPSVRDGVSGGQREFIPTLVKGQIAAGADGLFMETHPNVDKAKSDKETQFPLQKMRAFIETIYKYHLFAKENPISYDDKSPR